MRPTRVSSPGPTQKRRSRRLATMWATEHGHQKASPRSLDGPLFRLLRARRRAVPGGDGHGHHHRGDRERVRASSSANHLRSRAAPRICVAARLLDVARRAVGLGRRGMGRTSARVRVGTGPLGACCRRNVAARAGPLGAGGVSPRPSAPSTTVSTSPVGRVLAEPALSGSPPLDTRLPVRVVKLGKRTRAPTMKVFKTPLAILTCVSTAMLTAPSALAQSEPWWSGAPDAPAQSAPAQKAAAPQTPAPQLPALPPPQTPASPQAAAPQAPAPPQIPAPPVAREQAPSQPPPQAEPPRYPAPPQAAGQTAPQGEWVYTAQSGWIWVPRGSTTTTVGVEPYAYLYMPSYGWGWYVSPWGLGPFHYGPWGWGPRWGMRYAPPGWGGIHGYGGRGYFGAGRGYGGFRGGGGHGGGHR